MKNPARNKWMTSTPHDRVRSRTSRNRSMQHQQPITKSQTTQLNTRRSIPFSIPCLTRVAFQSSDRATAPPKPSMFPTSAARRRRSDRAPAPGLIRDRDGASGVIISTGTGKSKCDLKKTPSAADGVPVVFSIPPPGLFLSRHRLLLVFLVSLSWIVFVSGDMVMLIPL